MRGGLPFAFVLRARRDVVADAARDHASICWPSSAWAAVCRCTGCCAGKLLFLNLAELHAEAVSCSPSSAKLLGKSCLLGGQRLPPTLLADAWSASSSLVLFGERILLSASSLCHLLGQRLPSSRSSTGCSRRRAFCRSRSAPAGWSVPPWRCWTDRPRCAGGDFFFQRLGLRCCPRRARGRAARCADRLRRSAGRALPVPTAARAIPSRPSAGRHGECHRLPAPRRPSSHSDSRVGPIRMQVRARRPDHPRRSFGPADAGRSAASSGSNRTRSIARRMRLRMRFQS